MSQFNKYLCPECKDLDLKLIAPADASEPTIGQCQECGFEREIEDDDELENESVGAKKHAG
ncbi:MULTISPECIES: hypothetical protein [Rhodococcus erythropolis group]|uniref:Uncharacterized protein n=1 Tax=Rhodococcus baikonurensis TaxID=172041 RepID=A0ABV5XF81_9NOCA|nr:hypothetical protein [Rhodococcus qingshengii]MCT6735259.1 hypothetical protein [Rhodococcus qingshengii]